MNLTATSALIGLFGVILGVTLRPFIEHAFSRRKNLLILELARDQTSILGFANDAISLQLAGSSIDRLFQRSFTLRNKTGRTLTDLDMDFILDYRSGVAERASRVSIYEAEGVEFEGLFPQSPDGPDKCKVRRFGRDKSFKGQVNATYLYSPSVYVNNGLEVKLVDRSHWRYNREIQINFFVMLVAIIVIGVGRLLRQ